MNKKKRVLFALCLSSLLSSCSVNVNWSKSSKGSEAKQDDSKSEKTSEYSAYTEEVEILEDFPSAKLYFGSLNKEKTFSLPCCYFTFAEDVPYVSVYDYYESFFAKALAAFFKVGDYGEVTNKNTKASLTFDAASNSVWSDDFDQFVNYTGLQIPSDIFSATDTASNSVSVYSEERSSYTKGQEFTIELDDYHMSLVEYGGEVYAPFSVLDSITLSPLGYSFAWNGNAFYYVSSDAFYSGNSLTEYGQRYYSGDLAVYDRSQSFADYNYYSFLFHMSNFYGKFHSLGIDDLDDKFEELGLKSKLTSRLPSTADSAIADAINQVFCDGGHTYFQNRGFGCKYSASKDNELQGELYTEDLRYQKESQAEQLLSHYRNEAKETTGLSNYGSTAIIRFDSFDLNSAGRTPTKANIANDSQSTFAILYNSFQKISKMSGIKNVVFDVSMNGGGVAIALGQALSFITDDPVTINAKNYRTGATFKEAIYVDNDLDGNASDDDSYAGKYDFYILTSAASFSCANAFPCMAKENGYAKIIGQRSGGGDCTVVSGSTPDGTSFAYSSNTSLIHADQTSFDDGAEVDYEIDYANFYNIKYIDSFLSSLS